MIFAIALSVAVERYIPPVDDAIVAIEIRESYPAYRQDIDSTIQRRH